MMDVDISVLVGLVVAILGLASAWLSRKQVVVHEIRSLPESGIESKVADSRHIRNAPGGKEICAWRTQSRIGHGVLMYAVYVAIVGGIVGACLTELTGAENLTLILLGIGAFGGALLGLRWDIREYNRKKEQGAVWNPDEGCWELWVKQEIFKVDRQ